MKKILKSKNPKAPTQTGSDVAGFMAKIQEQLAFLANKVDALFGHVSEKPSGSKEPPKTVRQADRDKFIAQPRDSQPSAGYQQGRGRSRGRGRTRRERVMHKAVCGDCHKECEIPFQPSGTRPVYCNDCYAKHKASGSSQTKVENKQAAAADFKGAAGRHEAAPAPSYSRIDMKGPRRRDYGRSPRNRQVPVAPAPSALQQQRPETVIKKKVGRVTVAEVIRSVPKK